MLSRYNVSHAFKRAIRKAKVEDFRFHDLRHTFATRLVQAGKDLYKVQRLLGHKTVAMTQRYAHHIRKALGMRSLSWTDRMAPGLGRQLCQVTI